MKLPLNTFAVRQFLRTMLRMVKLPDQGRRQRWTNGARPTHLKFMPPISCMASGCCINPIFYFKNVLPLMIFGSPGCEVLATGLCQIQETGMNAVIYLITDAIVLIVDTRLRLLTEIISKGMQKYS